MHRIWRNLLLLLVGLTSEPGWAGNSGLNVIVVVNQNSTNSVQLGNDYCEKRGVPPQNLLRMTGWTGSSINWSISDFETYLRNPLLEMIAARNLSHQSSLVLLSMDIPYRIADASGFNSTTAGLFYGFKPDGPPPDPSLPPSCSLPDLSSNSYCYSEWPFMLAPPNTAPTNSFLAMMLTGTNLAAAELILARGLASDSSFPTQKVYLEKTSDWARNVRFLEFDNASFESRVHGEDSPVRIESDSTAFTNLLGLSTGLANLSLPGEAFVAGAMADSLTSFGGYILENSGQTPLLAFLDAGASGSYGTVVEPCNYLQKFPDPLAYFYQQRGFCLAEAYYQSLQNPYQGLLMGEPLSAPFAISGTADWSSLTNNSVVSGEAQMNLSFSSGTADRALDQVDLFVDATFLTTLTNVPPMAGNVIETTLNGTLIDYTLPAGATLFSAATGLAAALNAQTNLTRVQAWAIGDRVQLQSLVLTNAGSNIAVSVQTSAGTAGATTVQARASRSAFLDTIATGYVGVLITNTPVAGDWLQCDFLKTNGAHIVLAVTNTTAETNLAPLVQNLYNQINSRTDLQSTDGCYAGDLYADSSFSQFILYARSAGWAAAQAQLTLTSSTNLYVFPASAPLQDNVSDLRPRNHLYLNCGLTTLPVQFTLDTTQLADGFHELTAVAYEGSSVETQTHVSRTIRVQNTALSASFTPLVVGTNVTLDTPLQFAVSANLSNISRIELFSTGGSLGAISNQANATITVASATLGLGLHPFYAMVSDASGNRYRTPTVWLRLIPSFSLTIGNSPLSLSWPAFTGQQYEVLMSTNLFSPFQVVATLTATNSPVLWSIPVQAALGAFYQVRLR